MRSGTSSDRSSVPGRRRQILPLTGIRGVACVWVLLFHGYLLLRDYRVIGEHDLLFRGYLGVDLFFVLSGFVLAMTYGASLASPGVRAIGHFYLSRAFRILPLHWVVLLAFAIAAPMMSGIWWLPSPHTPQRWLASFLLVQSWIGEPDSWNSPAWSLSAEWGAYLAFPALAWIVWRVRSHRLVLALGVAALALLALAAYVRYGDTFYGRVTVLGLVRCACEFTAGMLAFRFAGLTPRVGRHGGALLAAGLALLILTLSFPQTDWPAPFAFCLIVLACWSDAGMAKFLFGNRLVAWLGEISFSLYIVHWFLIECAFGLLAGGPHGSRDPVTATAAVTLALVSAVPIAALLYRYVERPSHRLGRYVLRRERRVSADGAALTSSAR